VYNTGSERINKDLSGLLVGNNREASIEVWLKVKKIIIVIIEASSNRRVLLVV
jgi:hypothetical protein